MSQPERTLLPFPRGRARRGSYRDARIDAFRGLALAMIFIDHIPGNPYENFTLRNWGFSDAAEAFFVMSGIAAGLAYSVRFAAGERAQAGIWPAVAPIWSRAWTLYLAHVFLTISGVAIFALGAQYLRAPELLQMHNLGFIFDAPETALIGIPLMSHQIGYVNILPTYAVLLLALPVALMIALWKPWLAAALSLCLWFAAGIWHLNLPNYPQEGEWFFNPVAWQFIFVVGLLIGIRMKANRRLVGRSMWLFALATAYLLVVLAWRLDPALGEFMNHQMWRLGEIGAPFHLVSHDKTFLSLPRMLHVLALVYVISCLPFVTRACGSSIAAPLRLMGRHGLLVFSAGTLGALALQVVFFGFPDRPMMAWVMPPVGLLVLVGIAYAADMSRALRAPKQTRADRALPEEDTAHPAARESRTARA